MNVISVLLLIAAGVMIGLPLTLWGIRLVYPDLYREMVRRCDDGKSD